jgi:hypothetical protein
LAFSPHNNLSGCIAKPKGATANRLVLRNRSTNNSLLKRDVGFASQDSAKMAAREDAKKMKSMG